VGFATVAPMRGVIAALLLLANAGCSTGSYRATWAPVDSDGHALRDAQGRTLILRGANVKQAGLFDVTFSDGRAPREDVPPFDAADLALFRASGFNVIRLPINWSALEPQPGQYQAAYLELVAAFVDQVRGQGIYVLLDPRFSCDGAAVNPTHVDGERRVYTVPCGGAGGHTLLIAGS
jgi:hypothetical protein